MEKSMYNWLVQKHGRNLGMIWHILFLIISISHYIAYVFLIQIYVDRSDSSEYLEDKVKPFDWTFTTDYTGTTSGFEIEETNERIDMDKLRQKDKIMFYNDLTLFEDELHDNGIAVSSVKIVSYCK